MSKATYLRILGYTVTIAMHVGNIVFMNFCMKRELVGDPELTTFSQLQPRYFTCWTFFLQILYAVVGLTSDFKLLSNSKSDYKPSKYLQGFRNTLFSAILWPSTWVVSIVFWSLFLYDKKLIFPSVAAKVVTPASNHIMHTAIIGVVLWEVCFQPRTVPKSHKRNLCHLAFHLLLYFSILTYTYVERSIWIYPIFEVLYGTIYFPLLPLLIGVLAITFYYLQWTLTELLWGGTKKTMKIK
ncbi:androgen-dependent TFPI-regulating protein-like [Nymphalis io]|uniref:androgen-dependent TFPI-regulating protein-like n=1 Tax=Inachis io TaxID=171585 RepID=UPI00216A955B|nr:androgen-dependent TFPI-regulating protein-like [Nymphalis io]XP_050358943.1 androgen-dependent TFPI-regulating protein-like [Nymphalis io]XP_050358944.1 androgen-dependent TFPI-regulating protein-like [Nymphalis io]XP_050358945.1 androgen-dependent TFPI-regulating protein-like [Nymphalis io]